MYDILPQPEHRKQALIDQQGQLQSKKEMGDSGETKGKVITCKAAVVWGPGQPIVIEEVQVHPPQKMEVRMKILYTSICHTDLSAWKGENEAQQVYPRILGHEAAGIVESVGEGVLDLREGDNVVPIFNGECGECAHCKSDKTNLCEKFRVNPMKSVMVNDGKTRFWTRDGQHPIYHFLNTSTFVEYTVMDSACVVKIDAEAPLRKMSLLSCGVSTGVGAAWNTANVQAGSSVAIFGLGAVGLAVAEGARLRGASQIIGVDINPDKFMKGEMIGITHFINPNDLDKEKGKAVHEIIHELTKGGVDYSFECSGNLDVLREAFLSTHDRALMELHLSVRSLRSRILSISKAFMPLSRFMRFVAGCGAITSSKSGWGLTVILGIHPTPRMLPLHPMELFDGRRITGSVFGDFKGKTQLPHFALECMRGVVNLDEFITHELPFSEINQAFQLLTEGKALRCLLHL